jgi:CxxC motif-containing protein (DUF1111 family)
VDAPPECNQVQTDFARELQRDNLTFRIPTPTFGLGLIEAIPDSVILANKTAHSNIKAALGISGRENRSDNDGTITRFGWKAQSKSLVIFSGEAYNVEQGVSNELFPNSREASPDCLSLPDPEDGSDFETSEENGGDAIIFAMFMRFLAPPSPVNSYGRVSSDSIRRGRELFGDVGCVYCHTESLRTRRSYIAALSHKEVPLYSDLLLHRMGSRLADDVSQGAARGDEFRTAPLWGLGQRIFLLHDGRTRDLVDAIRFHGGNGSEANAVTERFFRLRDSNQQDVLNFLRSL